MTQEQNDPPFDEEFEPGERFLDERVGWAENELKKLDDEKPFDRAVIDQVWRALAEGNIGVHSAALWAETIAKRITKLVLEPHPHSGVGDKDRERDRRALRAIGISGMPSKNHDIQRDLEFFLQIENLYEKKRCHNRLKAMDDFLKGRGHYAGLSDKQIDNRIRRLLKNSN